MNHGHSVRLKAVCIVLWGSFTFSFSSAFSAFSLSFWFCATASLAAQEQPKPAEQPPAEEVGYMKTLWTIKGALSVQEAVAIAQRESPLLGIATEDVNMAEARVGIAKSLTRPILSITSAATGGTMPNTLATPTPVMPRAEMGVPRRAFFNQNAMLMFPLFTGGRLPSIVRKATQSRNAASADLIRVRLDVALETKVAYRQVLLAKEIVRIQEAWVKEAKERLRIDRAAYEVGKIPLFYVLRDETELANAQQQLTNSERDVEIAMVELKTVMGVHPSSQIELTENLSYQPIALSLEEILSRAEKQRPELTATWHGIEAARASVKEALSAYKPQVGLAMMGDLMTGKGMAGNGGYTVGVVLGLPILDGGMRRWAVREAQAQVRQKLEELERVRLQVAKEVQTVFYQVQAADKNVHTAEVALSSAREDYRVAQARYITGRSIVLEAIDALVALVRAETNYVQALFEFNVAHDQLLRSLGEQ